VCKYNSFSDGHTIKRHACTMSVSDYRHHWGNNIRWPTW
jgi:hypothetical protein